MSKRDEDIELLIAKQVIGSSSDLDGISDDIVETMADEVRDPVQEEGVFPSPKADIGDMRRNILLERGFTSKMGVFSKNGHDISMMEIRGFTEENFDAFLMKAETPILDKSEKVKIEKGVTDGALMRDKVAMETMIKAFKDIVVPEFELPKLKNFAGEIEKLRTKIVEYSTNKMP